MKKATIYDYADRVLGCYKEYWLAEVDENK